MAVNQRDASRGWTPLMRCARMAHYKHAPFLRVGPLWRVHYVLLWRMQYVPWQQCSASSRRHMPRRAAAPSQGCRRSPRPAQPCAHILHSPNILLSSPLAQVFEYLLQKGADPAIKSFPGPGPSPELKAPQQLPQPPLLLSNADGELGVLDVATHKGFGWEPGAVRAELARIIEQYKDVPKAPPTVYYGPQLGERGEHGSAQASLCLGCSWPQFALSERRVCAWLGGWMAGWVRGEATSSPRDEQIGNFLGKPGTCWCASCSAVGRPP